MQHDLQQREQGHEQSGDLSVARWLWALLICIGLATLWIGMSRPTQPVAATSGPVVLISGRDDHGLLAQPTLALLRGPGQRRAVATVPDATFARVLDEQGEWLRVQPIAAPQHAGWINDYDLRSRALWLERGVQVEFIDARVTGTGLEVAVRPQGSATPVTWVPAAQLREVGVRDTHEAGHTH